MLQNIKLSADVKHGRTPWRDPVVVYFLKKYGAKRLSLTWGWPEVLSWPPIVQILNKWAWPELFSVPFKCISTENQRVRGSFLLTNSSQWSPLRSGGHKETSSILANLVYEPKCGGWGGCGGLSQGVLDWEHKFYVTTLTGKNEQWRHKLSSSQTVRPAEKLFRNKLPLWPLHKSLWERPS